MLFWAQWRVGLATVSLPGGFRAGSQVLPRVPDQIAERSDPQGGDLDLCIGEQFEVRTLGRDPFGTDTGWDTWCPVGLPGVIPGVGGCIAVLRGLWC